MRPSSLRPREITLLLFAMLACAACGGGVEISLQLRPGIDDATGVPFDTTAIHSLHVKLTSAGKVDEQTLPLDATQQVALQPKHIDKQNPVHFDVRGCDGDTCEAAGDVAFRGCTHEDPDFSQQEGRIPVIIELFPVGDLHVDACGSL